jgi:hypothetical protein
MPPRVLMKPVTSRLQQPLEADDVRRAVNSSTRWSHRRQRQTALQLPAGKRMCFLISELITKTQLKRAQPDLRPGRVV